MILGLDPGRKKTGWALVDREGNLILSGILSTLELDIFLEIFKRPSGEWEESLCLWTYERRSFIPEPSGVEYIALGDGTGSREMASRLLRSGQRAVFVNERGTTLAARELYWRLHDPVWWQKVLPRSLRVPLRNLDDLAAWEIVLRSFAVSS